MEGNLKIAAPNAPDEAAVGSHRLAGHGRREEHRLGRLYSNYDGRGSQVEREGGSNLIAVQLDGKNRRNPERPTAFAGGVREEGGCGGEEITEETVLERNAWSDRWDGSAYLGGCWRDGAAAGSCHGLGLCRDIAKSFRGQSSGPPGPGTRSPWQGRDSGWRG